jgi:Holliday junction resolvase-like predicted endonuclease
MLDENDVVDAVCRHLEKEGYTILQQRRTTERGIDIVAQHGSWLGKLLVEAKGGTSTRRGSARFEKEYTLQQVFDRVAKGFYTAVELYCKHRQRGEQIGLAFPDSDNFRKYLARIEPF